MEFSVVDSLVRASISAIVLGVFALTRRHMPAKPPPKFAVGWSLDELSARFAFTQWLVGVGMVLSGGALAWGIHSILVTLNQSVVAFDSPADFVLFPQSAIWWFLPGFAAITLAWDITLGAWSIAGDRNEVMLYNYWTTAKAGFDSTRVLRIMALVIGLPITILTLLEVPSHCSLSGTEIRVRGFGFGDTKAYRYSEARKLTVIQGFRNRDGKMVKRAGVLLDFSDGRRWSSANFGDFVPTVDPKLVSYLQAKTGLPVESAVAESDVH
jgi:hypothetical protein